MAIRVLSFWSLAWYLLCAALRSQRGALSFSVTNVITKGLGGRKVRLVSVTFDALYVNGTGYTVTPGNCNLNTRIVSMTSMNLEGYQVSVEISGVNAVLKAWKGNTEAATNEAGLDTLVGVAMVIWH